MSKLPRNIDRWVSTVVSTSERMQAWNSSFLEFKRITTERNLKVKFESELTRLDILGKGGNTGSSQLLRSCSVDGGLRVYIPLIFHGCSAAGGFFYHREKQNEFHAVRIGWSQRWLIIGLKLSDYYSSWVFFPPSN